MKRMVKHTTLRRVGNDEAVSEGNQRKPIKKISDNMKSSFPVVVEEKHESAEVKNQSSLRSSDQK